MTSINRDELALQLQNARLQVDKDLLAAKASEAAFREQIKDMLAANQKAMDANRLEIVTAISKNAEAFQTLRSDVNVRIASANENTEKLRADMHKGFSEQHRWFIGVLVSIALAAFAQIYKSQDTQPKAPPPAAGANASGLSATPATTSPPPATK